MAIILLTMFADACPGLMKLIAGEQKIRMKVVVQYGGGDGT